MNAVAASDHEAGFTLIEVMISLALFALIAVAGVALVDAELRVQAHTAGRLERLGDLQRAMFVLANDLGQTGGGPVAGDGGSIRFSRMPPSQGPIQAVRYGLADATLARTVGDGAVQTLLGGVAAVRWRYYRAGDGWIDRWPPSPQRAAEWPQAVSIDIALKPAPDRPAGTLRRLVALPGQP